MDDEPRSNAQQALHDQLADRQVPVSHGAEAYQLVSGVLPTTDAATVLTALAVVRELHEELATWEPRLVEAARALGTSWNDLAPVLGVASRQAAERRYLRMRPARADEADTTRDQRVQNERDRRAETRAVHDWARMHAATLRLVAARVADLRDTADLHGPARHRVETVHRSLGSDDLTAVLAALIAVGTDLTASHPGLAQSIDDLAEQANQQRGHTRRQRSSAETSRSPIQHRGQP